MEEGKIKVSKWRPLGRTFLKKIHTRMQIFGKFVNKNAIKHENYPFLALGIKLAFFVRQTGIGLAEKSGITDGGRSNSWMGKRYGKSYGDRATASKFHFDR